MDDNKLHLIVSMPGRVVMDEFVGMVILTAASGNFGVLPGYEPASIALRNGPLRIKKGDDTGDSAGGGDGGSGGGSDGNGGGNGDGGTANTRAGEVALIVMGGYATVRNDTVNVMTPIADTPERIERAIESIMQEREHNKKYEQTANLEASRAEMALRNILLRRGDSMLAYPMSHIGNDE